MRIAYVYLAGDLDGTVGITNKVTDQITAWCRSGHEVRLFIQAHSPPGLSSQMIASAGISVDRFVDRPVRGLLSWRAVNQRLTTVGALASAVRRWSPSLIYARFTVSYPSLVAMAGDIPLVLEINTDDVAEYRAHLTWYKYWYHRLTRGDLLRAAAGTVYATQELAARPHLRGLAARSVVITNGANLQRYQPLPARPGPRPRLLFVGEPGFPWHGIDKVLMLARLCPDWDFDLVGFTPADIGNEQPNNVRPHGYLQADRYRAIAAEADVAFGTLALHRKKMNEACPLKVREYLAYGIPTVVGYRDADFTNGASFLLELPNTPDNVVANLAAIRAFVARSRGRRVDRGAIAHLDLYRKERERLAFFERVIRNGGTPSVTRS